MFVATQGTEGGRLNTDASMKERLEWQTLLVACSNASFVEYLIKKQKSTTAGMRRVFEFEYDKKDDEPGMINAVDASRISRRSSTITVGSAPSTPGCWPRSTKTIAAMVGEIIKDFREEVNGTVDENYWWGICGVSARRGYAGQPAGGRARCRGDAGIPDRSLSRQSQDSRHRGDRRRITRRTPSNGWRRFSTTMSAAGNVIFIDKVFDKKAHQDRCAARAGEEPSNLRAGCPRSALDYHQQARDARLL